MPKENIVHTVTASVTYLDNVFRSRVIVFPNGDLLRVFCGEVVAKNAAQIEYLDTHPDFKRIEERG
ncbi:hypothetical protein A8H40_24690 [Burkholderia multivorans]|uniref:hypothetical protein n=1 Tax=Burkholderia multivorans TaxID=87883 RepID=UPI0005656D4E|nr:hypothetical protein NP80_2178 [Burkholderia multivorans ATCC BAA-247]AVR22517.1 hypothetical protein A8H40_24690 [Burkholderia multivorans]MBU9494183.1 hypothetical protein [Burkholderia multivorans]SAK15464.1 hypothetical protein UA21_01173 [Burkholderia multivorans]SAK15497.1 hypothetical protein UA19_01170 [Burkholderia multivorans]